MTAKEDPIKAEQDYLLDHPLALLKADYLTIKTKSAELIPLRLNPVQQKLLAIIEEKIAEDKPVRILTLKARQMGICLHPDTRILTASLKWKSIDSVRVGEKLVATDEDHQHKRGCSRGC